VTGAVWPPATQRRGVPRSEPAAEVHLHFHGIGPAELAAILADVNRQDS
jgi:hypothetical protein